MKKNIRKIIGPVTFLLLMFDFLNAQEQEGKIFSGFSLESKLHYGFIIRHHPEMAVMSDIHFPVFEVALSKRRYGNRPWEQIYGYPETGISFWQCRFSNSTIVGHGYAVYPFIRFPLLRGNRLTLNFRFGVGLGYLSKKFDRLENYKNLAIGSHLNAIINLMFESSYKIGNRFKLGMGISLTHFSSGTIELPNYGLNIPAINLGLSYNLGKKESPFIAVELPEPDRSWEHLVIASMGIKEISPIDNKKYFVYNISGDFLKPMSYKYKLGGGVDLFYDNSKVDALSDLGKFENKFSSNASLGLHFAYEQTISKLSVIIQLGTYIYDEHNIDGNVYEKLIINYLLTSRFLASISLKAHYARADFIAWGIGCKI